MFQDKIKSLFSSSIQAVVSRISDFAVHPEKDFTHREKFVADILLAFLFFSRPKFSPAEYFVEPFPARSCVQIAALPKGSLMEVELIAKIPE